MKKTVLGLAIAAVVAAPSAVAGQGLGVAARAGTLGAGGEVALALSNSLVVRGGLSWMPLDIDATIDDVDVTISLPKTWFNIGVDLYLTGALRIGAGFLFKPDDFELTSVFDTDQDIGGVLFTPQEIGTLTGRVDVGDRVPYALIGFGKHTSSGIGLSLDVGAAFLEEPSVSLAADGTAAATMQPQLTIEAQDFETEIPTWAKIWPILSLAIRIGVG